MMTNRVVIQSSKCADCVPEKSRFSKQTQTKKSNLSKINLKLFIC